MYRFGFSSVFRNCASVIFCNLAEILNRVKRLKTFSSSSNLFHYATDHQMGNAALDGFHQTCCRMNPDVEMYCHRVLTVFISLFIWDVVFSTS